MRKFTNMMLCVLCFAFFSSLPFLSGCGRENLPENGAPEPSPLNGTFVSEYGTFTFNGDGKSIRYDLSDSFALAAGFPDASGEGEYVFLFHHGQYRYDLAETFEITDGTSRISFINRHHMTNETRICIQSPENEEEYITFQLKLEQKEDE